MYLAHECVRRGCLKVYLPHWRVCTTNPLLNCNFWPPLGGVVKNLFVSLFGVGSKRLFASLGVVGMVESTAD